MVESTPPTVIEMDPKVAHQIKLEELFSSNQLVPKVRTGFMSITSVDLAGFMDSIGVPRAFGFDVLTQIAIHRQATVPTMVGILYHHFKNSQLTVDMLLKCYKEGLLDWSHENQRFVVKYAIPKPVQEEIDKFQYRLPMIVKPKKVKKNTDSGYLIGKESIILRNNHHDGDVCLDHINRMNRIKFVIDDDTANMIKNKWRDLDKARPGESDFEYKRRIKAFNKYDRTAKAVIDLLLAFGKEFYFTHKVDKRGRTYNQGYHVHYQGTPWNKAVIQLANKEIIPDE